MLCFGIGNNRPPTSLPPPQEIIVKTEVEDQEEPSEHQGKVGEECLWIWGFKQQKITNLLHPTIFQNI